MSEQKVAAEAVGSSAELGLEPERALWEAMGCIADDEVCLRMLHAHVTSTVAADRERCAKPLRQLGARLAQLLDEDQWSECEALLMQACTGPNT